MTLDPIIAAQLQSERYIPGDYNNPIHFPKRHGHFAHVCKMPRESLGPRPEIPIRIEKIGGGAAPEGYAAILWPDEMHRLYFIVRGNEPVEDWTEELCLTRTIQALMLDEIPDWKRDLHNDLNPFLSGRDKLEIQFQVLDLVKRVDAHLLPND